MSALSKFTSVEIKSLESLIKNHTLPVVIEALTDIVLKNASVPAPRKSDARKSTPAPVKGKGQEPKTAITAEHVRDWTWVNFNLPEGVKPTDAQCAYLKSQKGRFSEKRKAWYITSQVDIAALVAALNAA